MKVLVKSLKNAPEQHDSGRQTTENASIKYEHALISFNLFIILIAAHFVMKVNANDVLYQKLLPFELHTSVYQTGGAPNRSARGMLQEKTSLQNKGLQAFHNLTDKPMMSMEQCSTTA